MWDSLHDVMQTFVFGVSVRQLLFAFLAVLLGFLAKRIFEFILARLAAASEKTEMAYDNILLAALSKPLGWGAAFAGIFIASQILPLPTDPIDLDNLALSLGKGLSILLVIWFAIRLSDGLFEHWKERAAQTETRLDDQAVPILQRTFKVFLILLGVSLFLANMGYSVTSLIAGLGLGGAALALASKDTLSNFFGAAVIFFDRPFQIGDWIDVGGVEGTVEEVGLRTTRIRTFANSLITLPNASLTTSSINNWSRMQKRRIKMTIGVTYDTKADHMQAAVEAVREIIRQDENILQDYYLVNFDALGNSSLEIFIYCFTKTTNWAEYLEVKQQFLLAIMRKFESMGLSFAFPTQSLHIESLPDRLWSGKPERPE